MSARHVLKVVPPYMDALLDGSKTFEVRRNDRGFQRGDTLVLWEMLPGKCTAFPCDQCAPRSVEAEVTYVYGGDPRFGDWPAGTVVLGIKTTADVTP